MVKKQTLIVKVYGITFLGILLTLSTGLFFAQFEYDILMLLASLILPFVFLILLSKKDISPKRALIFYILFTISFGGTLGITLKLYSITIIFKALLSTLILFSVLTVYGLVTKRDFSKIGSFLTVGLITLILVTLINIFLRSSLIDIIVSWVGLGIFLLFVIYDTQKLKEEENAVMGAVNLYLDFINIFTYLLEIFKE